jgi:hypothetical protein
MVTTQACLPCHGGRCLKVGKPKLGFVPRTCKTLTSGPRNLQEVEFATWGFQLRRGRDQNPGVSQEDRSFLACQFLGP